MMKKIITAYFLALGGLFLTTHAQQNTPMFEFWNKTNQPIYFYFGGKNFDENAQLAKIYGMSKLEGHSYSDPATTAGAWRASSETNVLVISVGELPRQDKPLYVYQFKPSAYGKTLYIRVKEGKQGPDNIEFGPQTGTFLGFSGKTERGYPLKNNVKQSDIQDLGIDNYTFKPTQNQNFLTLPAPQ